MTHTQEKEKEREQKHTRKGNEKSNIETHLMKPVPVYFCVAIVVVVVYLFLCHFCLLTVIFIFIFLSFASNEHIGGVFYKVHLARSEVQFILQRALCVCVLHCCGTQQRLSVGFTLGFLLGAQTGSERGKERTLGETQVASAIWSAQRDGRNLTQILLDELIPFFTSSVLVQLIEVLSQTDGQLVRIFELKRKKKKKKNRTKLEKIKMKMSESIKLFLASECV